jgi:hypothetical protein
MRSFRTRGCSAESDSRASAAALAVFGFGATPSRKTRLKRSSLSGSWPNRANFNLFTMRIAVGSIRDSGTRPPFRLPRHRFAGIQPNSSYRDYSRLSCAAGEMPLGPRAAGIFSKRCAPKWPSSGIVRRELAAVSADPKMLRRRPNQQYHCALCAGLWAQRERVW